MDVEPGVWVATAQESRQRVRRRDTKREREVSATSDLSLLYCGSRIAAPQPIRQGRGWLLSSQSATLLCVARRSSSGDAVRVSGLQCRPAPAALTFPVPDI